MRAEQEHLVTLMADGVWRRRNVRVGQQGTRVFVGCSVQANAQDAVSDEESVQVHEAASLQGSGQIDLLEGLAQLAAHELLAD